MPDASLKLPNRGEQRTTMSFVVIAVLVHISFEEKNTSSMSLHSMKGLRILKSEIVVMYRL